MLTYFGKRQHKQNSLNQVFVRIFHINQPNGRPLSYQLNIMQNENRNLLEKPLISSKIGDEATLCLSKYTLEQKK